MPAGGPVLAGRQARRRLVEDEHLEVVRECPGDHHLLAFAGRERLDRQHRRRRAARRSRRRLGQPAGCRRALRNSPPARGASESSVRLSATVVPGTMPASISWWTVWTPARRASSGVAGANGSAAYLHRPARRADRAGEDLDQRRLAGTVGADEADDLSGGDVERNLAEDLARSVAASSAPRSATPAVRVNGAVVRAPASTSLRSLTRRRQPAMGWGRGRACSVPERPRSAG